MNTQSTIKRLILSTLGVSITLFAALMLSNHLRSAEADDYSASQLITLEAGWNDIGFLVDTNNASPNNILTSRFGFGFGNNDLVKDISDGRFAQYYNGVWEGSLTSIDHTHGFRIEVQSPTEGKIYGDNFNPENITFQLDEGWNALPFYGPNTQAIDDVFASIEGDYELIKSNARFCEYVETLGCLGSLTHLVPGRMYQILMIDDDDFSYGNNALPNILPEVPTPNNDDREELLEAIADAYQLIGQYRDISEFSNLISKTQRLENNVIDSFISIHEGEEDLDQILQSFYDKKQTWNGAFIRLQNIRMNALDLLEDIDGFTREHQNYRYFQDEEDEIKDFIDTLEDATIRTTGQIESYDQAIKELEDEVGHKMDQFYLNQWVDLSEKEILPLLSAENNLQANFDAIREDINNTNNKQDLAQTSEKIAELFDEIDPETLFLNNEKKVFTESIQTDLQSLPGENDLAVLRSFISQVEDADDFETLTSLQEEYYEAYNSIIVELETLSFEDMRNDARDWADHMYEYAAALQDEVLLASIERYQRSIQAAQAAQELEDIFVQLHIIDQELVTKAQ